MAFRNRITELSQLIADSVIGAILQTASSGYYIKIWETVSGGINNGLIQFFMGNPEANQPGTIQTSATVNPGDFDLVQLKLISPTTTEFVTPASIEMEPNIAGIPGTIRLKGEVSINSPASAGAIIQGIDFGNDTDTTDANGSITINHALNAVPQAVVVTNRAGAGSRIIQVFSVSSTQFVVRFRDGTGALLAAGTNVSVFWIAFR